MLKRTHTLLARIILIFVVIAGVIALLVPLNLIVAAQNEASKMGVEGLAIQSLLSISHLGGRVFTLAFYAVLIAVVTGLFAANTILKPLRQLEEAAKEFEKGNLAYRVQVDSRDEFEHLAEVVNRMAARLGDSFAFLEQRIAERTQDLTIASQIGVIITEKVSNPYEMMAEAAEIIRSRFGLYHAQIYLLDSSGHNLTLNASTGEIGTRLLRQSHRLAVGPGSINGRAVSEQRTIVVEDTQTSANFLPNPLLPQTRSEMAVPLIIGEKVIGTLNVQSEHLGALSEANRPVFEMLANHLAVAIRNAFLFTETMQVRDELLERSRHATVTAWQEFLDGMHRSEKIGFSYAQDEVIPLVDVDSTPVESEGMLAVPIELAGAKIGEICLADEPGRAWTHHETELIHATANQVAQRLENLRLLAQAERYRSEAEEALRRLTREGWEEYLQQGREIHTAFLYDGEKVAPLDSPEHLGTTLSSDIKVRGEAVGQLSLLGAAAESLSEEERGLITSVTERLSAHIENLRLSDQTEQALAVSQKLAQREQALRQITAAVRSSTNLETILRITARELGSLLHRRTLVQLTPLTREGSAGSGSGDAPEQLAD
ncbi:MAG: hypothetical protein Fur0043_02600 [Anaerolineales bacterium]